MAKCSYCGSVDQEAGKKCQGCGAPIPNGKTPAWKSDPFFYNGFVCYAIRDWDSDVKEIQFWLGQDLIERIVIPAQVVDKLTEPGTDPIDLFWKLFKIARGEEWVLQVKERNSKNPVLFNITRAEDETDRWLSLSMQDLAEAARR